MNFDKVAIELLIIFNGTKAQVQVPWKRVVYFLSRINQRVSGICKNPKFMRLSIYGDPPNHSWSERWSKAKTLVILRLSLPSSGKKGLGQIVKGIK